MNRRTMLASLLAFAVIPASAALAKPANYISGGAALSGYDAVAYFQGGPKKGTKEFTTTYSGATYRFSSAANLASFKASPGKYAPAYGGYCAYAVANGLTAPGDPKAWSIRGGRLYVNLNQNVKKRWLANPAGYISSANRNWPKVLN